MYIIYNAGYKLNINIKGLSGKSYTFKKSFVIKVNNKKMLNIFYLWQIKI